MCNTHREVGMVTFATLKLEKHLSEFISLLFDQVNILLEVIKYRTDP